VAYRDALSGVIGVPPADLLAEENVRATLLAQMNKMGKRDIRSISEAVRDYYNDPDATLKALGLGQLHPIIRV
jgi:hypothetical protein